MCARAYNEEEKHCQLVFLKATCHIMVCELLKNELLQI